MTVSEYLKSSYKIWTKSRCLCTLTTALNISNVSTSLELHIF